MPQVQVAILAAGLGTRLGLQVPKPLTLLADGRSILAHQMENLAQVFGEDAHVAVVVGYRMEQVIHAFPDVRYVFNERYDESNTAKSLLKALRTSHPGGVLWLNGDVVFDPGLLQAVRPLIDADQTFVCVNTASVGEEEVKYTVDGDGYIRELSKGVVGGLGEAVGINYVASLDKATLIEHLERCAAQDYFERAIESAITEDRLQVWATDISGFFAVEVDFASDLERANAEVSRTVTSAA